MIFAIDFGEIKFLPSLFVPNSKLSLTELSTEALLKTELEIQHWSFLTLKDVADSSDIFQ